MEERVVAVDGGVPGIGDADFSSIDAVKRTFAAYEEPVLAACNKLREEIASDHIYDFHDCHPDRTQYSF